MALAGLATAGLAQGPRPVHAVKAPPAPPKLDFELHVARLKKRMPRGFHVVVQPPFVVVGDQSKPLVAAWATGTVKWAVDLLKKDFFAKDLDHIIDVWLFKDEKSYFEHTRALFGEKPTTPFGYYSSRHRALIMNIDTGGGTLVHEIVHPYMRVNFPQCPAWFNEGLASLYEQSNQKNGKIVGLTNWRLAGLQRAIRAGRTPPFRELLATTDRQFYQEDRGTNYAQARYLCYWLQEKKLLRKFYRKFVAGWKKDPTGYDTLCAMLGVQDLKAFQRDFEVWVLKLRFP